MIGEKLLTVEEVAEMLGLAPGSVYHMISERRIPVVRLSARCVRFRRSDIATWIAEKVAGAVPTKVTNRGGKT
jgi:excisionase family DNA binding protein